MGPLAAEVGAHGPAGRGEWGHMAPRAGGLRTLAWRAQGTSIEAAMIFTWRPPTHAELMAAFPPRQDAVLVEEVLDLAHDGARHQPRIRAGTRVRVLEILTGEPPGGPSHLVEVCDARGNATGNWAVVDERLLREAPELGLFDLLRALGAG